MPSDHVMTPLGVVAEGLLERHGVQWIIIDSDGERHPIDKFLEPKRNRRVRLVVADLQRLDVLVQRGCLPGQEAEFVAGLSDEEAQDLLESESLPVVFVTRELIGDVWALVDHTRQKGVRLEDPYGEDRILFKTSTNSPLWTPLPANQLDFRVLPHAAHYTPGQSEDCIDNDFHGIHLRRDHRTGTWVETV